MEFGRVSPEELAVTDFTLPPDAELTLNGSFNVLTGSCNCL